MFQIIEDVNWVVLKNEVIMNYGWKKYLEGLLDVGDDRKVKVNFLELGDIRNERSECETVSKKEI